MIEVKRDDFFVESIKNPIEYGTYYKINSKYGTGFQFRAVGPQKGAALRQGRTAPIC